MVITFYQNEIHSIIIFIHFWNHTFQVFNLMLKNSIFVLKLSFCNTTSGSFYCINSWNLIDIRCFLILFLYLIPAHPVFLIPLTDDTFNVIFRLNNVILRQAIICCLMMELFAPRMIIIRLNEIEAFRKMFTDIILSYRELFKLWLYFQFHFFLQQQQVKMSKKKSWRN